MGETRESTVNSTGRERPLVNVDEEEWDQVRRQRGSLNTARKRLCQDLEVGEQGRADPD